MGTTEPIILGGTISINIVSGTAAPDVNLPKQDRGQRPCSRGTSIEQRPIIDSSIRIGGNASIRPVIKSGWCRARSSMTRRAENKGVLISVNFVEINPITVCSPGVASINPPAPPSVAMYKARVPRKRDLHPADLLRSSGSNLLSPYRVHRSMLSDSSYAPVS